MHYIGQLATLIQFSYLPAVYILNCGLHSHTIFTNLEDNVMSVSSHKISSYIQGFPLLLYGSLPELGCPRFRIAALDRQDCNICEQEYLLEHRDLDVTVLG